MLKISSRHLPCLACIAIIVGWRIRQSIGWNTNSQQLHDNKRKKQAFQFDSGKKFYQLSTHPSADTSLLPTIIGINGKNIAVTKPEVAIIMLTSHHTARIRLPMMRKLYENEQDEIKNQVDTYYVTEQELAMNLTPWTQIIATGCGSSYTGGLCCKLSFAYHVVYDTKKHYKWVLRIVDDGFVDYENLLSYVKTMDPSRTFFLGENYVHVHLLPDTRPYGDGGAGWIVSRGAMNIFVPLLASFWKQGDEGCYDDVQFGKFMTDIAKLPIQQGSGMHNENFEIDATSNISAKSLVLSPRHRDLHLTPDKHPKSRIITWHSKYNGENPQFLFQLQALVKKLSTVLPVHGER